MRTDAITFAQNDEPRQFYHHRTDLGYLMIEILACLPAGTLSRYYSLEHLSHLISKSHGEHELPVMYSEVFFSFLGKGGPFIQTGQ